MNNSAKRPTLGYILKGYPRISETFISNEILQLERIGFRIVIFPMRQPRENFTHLSVQQIRAEVHYLPTHLFRDFHKWILPNMVLCVLSPLLYGRALSLAFSRFRRTKKGATFKHLFQAGYMVQRHLRRGTKVDQLHGHFAHSPTSVTMFASMLSGIPFSFTAHAKDIYTSHREQLREKIAKASFVITCTQYNSNYLSAVAGEAATPIHCVYHGIDTRLFTSPGARQSCSPPYTLLTFARLTEKKGLPTLLLALAELKKRKIPFHHTLIGDGDDRDKILALISQLELTNECTWLGTRTHEEVLEQFRRSDLFVLGCKIAENGDRDGIPNVLIESLAMGVPALSTDVSAIPEVLHHGETGITVPPDQHEKMADAIVELLTNSDLRSRIIANGQTLARCQFDNVMLTKKLGDIFMTHCSHTAA